MKMLNTLCFRWVQLSEFLHKVFLDVLILLSFLDQRIAFSDQFSDVLVIDERQYFTQRTPFVDADIAFCTFYLDEIWVSGILYEEIRDILVHLSFDVFRVSQLSRS